MVMKSSVEIRKKREDKAPIFVDSISSKKTSNVYLSDYLKSTYHYS